MSDPHPEQPTPQWFGHPRGLTILFNAELWERFSYYGMRALLVLYIIQALGRSESDAYALFAVYGALVYSFGVVGGWIAQRYIGKLRAIVIGGGLMAAGHGVMALPWADGLYLALALLCVGNGLFKPNVSTSVGALYADGDRRRARAYYLFYMGINIGGMLAPIVCGAVAERLGWHYGFGLAGIGMILGLLVVVRGRKLLRPHAPAQFDRFAAPLGGGARLRLAAALGLMILLCALGLWRDAWGHLAVELVSVGLVVALIVMAVRLRGNTQARFVALLVLMLFHTVFWAAFEQVGSSFTVLAEGYVDRVVAGVEIPASALVAINSAFVIMFAQLTSGLWTRLAQHNLEPSPPVKFVIGLVLLALGFFVMALGIESGLSSQQVGLGVLVLCYLLMTLGELCLSPTGLAMVTELSPEGATSFCMGAWFMTYANGHLLAGFVAASTSVAEASATVALERYALVFTRVGAAVVAAAVVLWFMRGRLTRMIETPRD